MKTITLDIIKVEQSIGFIYVAKVKPENLLNMSIVDRRKIENEEEILGIQRELKKDKVTQIKNYLSSIDATFPNSIIVNTNSKYIKNLSDKEITLEVNENTFSILDGQHRVEGFRNNLIDNFELIVAIFIDLKLEQQANIFSTINSQQTKVDPSLNLSLELNSSVKTPKKLMIEIAQSFHFYENSPWYNSIKILGAKTKGIISLSAFIKPLLELTYSEKDYYLIRNELLSNTKEFPDFKDLNYNSEKYIFWDLYKQQDFESIFKILQNFFNCLKVILGDDWLNEKSLLNKTTGYNAIIKLFRDIARYGLKNNNLTYEFMFETLKPLSEFNGTLNSSNYGASGQKASNELYLELRKTLANNVYK